VNNEELAKVKAALETGVDLAVAHADETHRAYAGYKPDRHAAVDRDVADMREALAIVERAATAPVSAVPLDLLRRCLTAMKHAVTYGETGKGRPPSQTCMFEIEELEALLSAGAPVSAAEQAGGQELPAPPRAKALHGANLESLHTFYTADQMREYARAALAMRQPQDDGDRILRSSVPDRYKACTSPIGAVQSYIAELEQRLEQYEPDWADNEWKEGQ
jgi:hypothetical protein